MRHGYKDSRDGGETTDTDAHFVSKMYGIDAADTKHFDKTPHDIFVQMSELNEGNTHWEERSRWIKYEECKEEGNVSKRIQSKSSMNLIDHTHLT